MGPFRKASGRFEFAVSRQDRGTHVPRSPFDARPLPTDDLDRYTARLVIVCSTAKGKGSDVGVKKTGRGRRKLGRKKRRMRARIRHRKK